MPRPCAVVPHASFYQDGYFCFRCHGLAPWCLTLASTRTAISVFDATALRRGASRWLLPGRLFLFSMPRPCAVVPHAGFYQDGYFSFRCHGLAPWCPTLASTRTAISLLDATALRRGASRWLLPGRLFLFSMPRPCAVVPHASFYQDGYFSFRCHGLAPWCLTLASTRTAISVFDATALRRGASRWLLPGRLFLFSMPRPCAVVPHAGFYQDGYFSFRCH